MSRKASPAVKRLAMWSIAVAIGVMALKLAAWHVTGSVALLSDAMESTVNVIAAVVAYSR
jgi:divalent metal cation (Fe/Co/Zn/Cd) transporter